MKRKIVGENVDPGALIDKNELLDVSAMTTELVSAYIGVGSNLNCPAEQIRKAVQQLGRFPETRFCTVSSLYQSEPIGVGEQPDFINAVVYLKTSLTPYALLKLLLQVESNFGRVRGPKNGEARILDLDLLLYSRQIIESDRLIVPHPRMHQRRFVLLPLEEIAPALEIPGYGAINLLIQNCEPHRVECLQA